MVRHAIETAVSASISTPVCPVTFTVAWTRKPGRLCSGLISISTLVIGSGWQSGISPWVRLAAMMPAMRAAPSTSPFMALPASTTSSVCLRMITRPSATATRSVALLAETSTMRASPRWSIWVSSALASNGAGFAFFFGRRATMFLPRAMTLLRRSATRRAREQCAGRRGDVGLPHQAFADQERRDADAREPGQIGRRIETAFGDDDALAWNIRRQPLAHGQRSLEAAQVAIVDADETRAQPERARKLLLVVHFHQHVHAIGEGRILDRLRRRIVNRRHDDQDAIGAERARFHHLIGLVDEILAQSGQRGGVARCAQEFRLALERRRIGEHGQTGGAAGFIGLGELRRIEIGADQALRRARLLDLGDQRVGAARNAALDRAHETARR